MILRLCVVIPSFDDARTISEVVKDVVTATPFPVLIVDDGSETPVSHVLYSWEVRQALEEGRVRVVRFEKNRGKGAALQAAIDDLVSRGFTHMVTMDGRGPIPAREILKLVEEGKKNPWDLILGNRGLKGTNSDTFTRVMNKFSRFFVSYETGAHIKDSQSGFRLYPLFALQTMRFYTRHYDFDIEVLIRLLWRGVSVHEIDVELNPEPWAPTHFNRFWDSLRIYSLNLILLSLSLLKTHRSPMELAIAVAAGVFIGATPLYGVHVVMILVVALIFRLNVVVMWIASHISSPILAPFLFVSELYVGRHWLGVTTVEHRTTEDFLQILAGSPIVGGALALVCGLATLLISWTAEKRRHLPNRSANSLDGRVGTSTTRVVLGWLGLRAGYFVSWVTLPYLYFFAPRTRMGLNEYWSLRDPSESWLRRQRRVLAQIHRYRTVLVDECFHKMRTDKYFTVAQTGLENIARALNQNSATVFVSARLGVWEFCASLLGTSAVIKMVDDLRPGCEIELIPFMGKLAPFDVSVFRSAAERRVPVLFTFGMKGEKCQYDFYARPAKQISFIDGESHDLQVYGWAREFVRDVEFFLTRYPTEWFNFYQFWSALPDRALIQPGQLVEDLGAQVKTSHEVTI